MIFRKAHARKERALHYNTARALTRLGFSAFFQAQMTPPHPHSHSPMRVVRVNKYSFAVHNGEEEGLATLSGKFKFTARDKCAHPVVGDWAIVETTENNALRITRLLKRKTAFERVAEGTKRSRETLAANIDIAFIVTAPDGDVNPNRLERYLLATEASGAKPVIILNKADMKRFLRPCLNLLRAYAKKTPIIVLSAKTKKNLSALKKFLTPGTTVVFLGSSGVGKSSIINALFGEEKLRTGSVRSYDGKGKHTTTAREAFMTPSGALVIDTPGLKLLAVQADAKDIGDAFSDIAMLAFECRFRNCSHVRERECAVKRAVENGTLDGARYAQYLALREEIAFLKTKDAARLEKRKKRSDAR